MSTWHMAIISVFAGLIIFSCDTLTDDSTQGLTSTSLQGNWKDTLDPNVLYFAGATHNLAIKNDSFNLAIYRFTDEVISGDSCYSISYTQHMKGLYYLGQQDSIMLDGIYVDSAMNAMPESQCDYGPKQSGQYFIAFKYQLDENKLKLTELSNPYAQEWLLTKY